ncbi:hypothetical protein F443_21224 [Phytophthora nicotianae P1569]|uniref:DDE Tnp4 domain-containing protein n=1 Tax=Phytophthora nicotianae P1569 TaxID=1317065 RepID=V9E016_PHYNI|nr:hypothetical protein F443_21224 [Phytophthora nicotianae P1569]
MLLVVMKCGGTWEMLSKIFQIKTPTFIKTIVGFLEVVAPKMYDKWIAEYAGESMPWYSAKHKLYGFKVEVSVNPRGLAINCTRHSRGNTADITMFHENQAFTCRRGAKPMVTIACPTMVLSRLRSSADERPRSG